MEESLLSSTLMRAVSHHVLRMSSRANNQEYRFLWNIVNKFLLIRFINKNKELKITNQEFSNRLQSVVSKSGQGVGWS